VLLGVWTVAGIVVGVVSHYTSLLRRLVPGSFRDHFLSEAIGWLVRESRGERRKIRAITAKRQNEARRF